MTYYTYGSYGKSGWSVFASDSGLTWLWVLVIVDVDYWLVDILWYLLIMLWHLWSSLMCVLLGWGRPICLRSTLQVLLTRPHCQWEILHSTGQKLNLHSTRRMGFNTTCARRRECVASCVALSALVLVTIVPYSPITYAETFDTCGSYGKSGLSVMALGFWLDMVVSACDCRRRLLLGDILLIMFWYLWPSWMWCASWLRSPPLSMRNSAQHKDVEKWTISRRSTWKRWSVACNASCLTVAEPLCHYVNSFE